MVPLRNPGAQNAPRIGDFGGILMQFEMKADGGIGDEGRIGDCRGHGFGEGVGGAVDGGK